MAEPLSSAVQIQDVPEWIKPYRNSLLNAAFASVFTPEYMQQYLPNATFWNATTQGGGAGAVPPPAATPGGTTAGGPDTRTDLVAPTETDKSGIAGALAPKTPKMLGLVWDAKTRTWVPEKYKEVVTTMAGGGSLASQVAEQYENIRRNAPLVLGQDAIAPEELADIVNRSLVGGVTYPERTGPFGNTSPSAPTSSWTVGSNIGSGVGRYAPPPDLTPTPAAPAAVPGGTNWMSGPSAAAPVRSAGTQAGRPSASGAPPVGTSASAAVLPQTVAGFAGTTPENRGAGGYNPAQYATDEQARGLASLLGGTTTRTNPIGPVAPPPQNLISFGGQDALNAGLVQQMLGPITVDGTSRPRTASEMSLSLAGLRDEIARSGGNTSAIDEMIRKNNAAYAASVSGGPSGPSSSAPRTPPIFEGERVGLGAEILSPTKKASGGSLAQFEIGEDGKVKNYRKGGVIRRVDGGPTGVGTGAGTTPAGTPFTGPNVLGFGTAQTPSAGGFGGSGGVSSLFSSVNPNVSSQNLFNPPPVYGGQRVLGFGQDFGQYTPGMGFTSSRMTTGALSGLENLPSIFKQYDVAGTGGAPGYSYTAIDPNTDFGKGLSNINWATDIAGVGAGSGLDLLRQVGLGPEATQQPSQQSYLMGLMPSIQQMGFHSPISVNPLTAPTLEAPTGVSAGQTQVGEFGAPTAEKYMSPYQQAVTEAQKREAVRQANMQRASRSAAAVRAGAFGGSRQAVQEGMAEEALQRQLGDIEAVGRQKAFEGAQAQFERDRAASLASQQANLRAALEAQMANQQAGLTAGQANLQAALGTQQLGTQAGLEAAKASQAGDLATWQMQLDAIKQASAEQQGMRQQDFANKLAALGQVQSGAAGLAGLGGTMMNIPALAQQLELQRLAALQQGGGAVDVRTQQALDLAYQDFINQQNFPYQQMNFLQGILSGVPVGMQYEGVQFQRPSAGGLTGLLTSGAGLLSNIYNK